MDQPDLPCDFTEFLACRLGLSSSDADALLATWLASYQPRARPVARIVMDEDHERKVANF